MSLRTLVVSIFFAVLAIGYFQVCAAVSNSGAYLAEAPTTKTLNLTKLVPSGTDV